VYRIHKFNLSVPQATPHVFEYRPNFTIIEESSYLAKVSLTRFHSAINSSVNSAGSASRVVFEHCPIQGPRVLVFLWRDTKIAERILVMIPREDGKEVRHRSLSAFEQVVCSDGKVFIVNYRNKRVFEWRNQSTHLVATFSDIPFGYPPIVRFSNGQLVCLTEYTGEFEVIETKVIESGN
jgi:hypothetical protein